GGDATLARIDAQRVIRGEAAEVEEVALDPRRAKRFLGDLREAEGLRDLAGTRAVVARRGAHHEDARAGRRVLLPCLGRLQPVARRPPLDGELVARIREPGPGRL